MRRSLRDGLRLSHPGRNSQARHLSSHPAKFGDLLLKYSHLYDWFEVRIPVPCRGVLWPPDQLVFLRAPGLAGVCVSRGFFRSLVW